VKREEVKAGNEESEICYAEAFPQEKDVLNFAEVISQEYQERHTM